MVALECSESRLNVQVVEIKHSKYFWLVISEPQSLTRSASGCSDYKVGVPPRSGGKQLHDIGCLIGHLQAAEVDNFFKFSATHQGQASCLSSERLVRHGDLAFHAKTCRTHDRLTDAVPDTTRTVPELALKRPGSSSYRLLSLDTRKGPILWMKITKQIDDRHSGHGHTPPYWCK